MDQWHGEDGAHVVIWQLELVIHTKAATGVTQGGGVVATQDGVTAATQDVVTDATRICNQQRRTSP